MATYQNGTVELTMIQAQKEESLLWDQLPTDEDPDTIAARVRDLTNLTLWIIRQDLLTASP